MIFFLKKAVQEGDRLGVWGCDGGKSFGAKSSLEGTIWACAIKSLDEAAGRA